MEDGTFENLFVRFHRKILFTTGFAVAVSAVILPRLVIHPANATKALVRNNVGALLQRVTGEVHAIPRNTALPSAPSTPSRDTSAIIVLLAWGFACPITCYFFILIRQKWPCDCGGRPNQPPTHAIRCPAERLKFLDDMLPILLQTGFILPCASLLLYLYYLNTATSVIVGIPLIIALAFSGICIIPYAKRFLAFCFNHKPSNDSEAEAPLSQSSTTLFEFPSSMPEPPLKGRSLPQSRVATGGFGEVHMGIWIPPDGKPVEVAIKRIRKDNIRPMNNQATGESRYDTRILREIVIWHGMAHKNVLKFIGYHIVNGEIWLVSPWCKNGTLASYVRNHPKLSEIEKLKLILGAARGLRHLHRSQPPVAHGDVKADNFLITDELEAALCDFGVSRLVIPFPKSGLTTDGQGTGSPGHQAKELFKENCPSTPASDIYALGGVILTVMTGRPPFYKMMNPGAIIIAINNDKTAEPKDHPGLSENHALWDLMRRCWDPNPVLRPSIGQVINEIETQIQRISVELPCETIDEG